MTRDEAFAKLGQGHELDDECKRIIAEEWGFNKVVRCKDCIYFELDHDAYWFCPFGERKEGKRDD